MAEIKESESLREKLKTKRVPVAEINKFLAYIRGAQQQESSKDSDKRPVTGNSDDMLYTMFIKWWALGLTIDGVNIVVTGKAMSMVTFHGYQNKVRKSYPDAKFDIQLVRGEDKFTITKTDGKISYRHELADPFGNQTIKGAYCVISAGGRDYFEALNKSDYDAMQNASKQAYLWKKWESEFWLKSVIKRACKRHFYAEVEEIDAVDNADLGGDDIKTVQTPDERKARMAAAEEARTELGKDFKAKAAQ